MLDFSVNKKELRSHINLYGRQLFAQIREKAETLMKKLSIRQ